LANWSTTTTIIVPPSDSGRSVIQSVLISEQGKLNKDDETGWVICRITKMAPQRLERFWQKQMTLEELTQPGWEDAADYFDGRDTKYGKFEYWVPAVV
jgi:hypothetical protein